MSCREPARRLVTEANRGQSRNIKTQTDFVGQRCIIIIIIFFIIFFQTYWHSDQMSKPSWLLPPPLFPIYFWFLRSLSSLYVTPKLLLIISFPTLLPLRLNILSQTRDDNIFISPHCTTFLLYKSLYRGYKSLEPSRTIMAMTTANKNRAYKEMSQNGLISLYSRLLQNTLMEILFR